MNILNYLLLISVIGGSLSHPSFSSEKEENGHRAILNPIIPEVKLSQQTIYHFWKDEDRDMILNLLQDCGLAKDEADLDPRNIVLNLRFKRGTYTKFLFEVNLREQSSWNGQSHQLIVKGIKNPKEIFHRSCQSPITELQSYAYLRESNIGALEQANNPFLPVLGLDLGSFWYFSPETQEKQYITILPKMNGSELSYFIEDEEYQANSIIKYIFKRVGRALGEFHYRLASPEAQEAVRQGEFSNFMTVNHHDFYPENILYDEDTDVVAFIDLATMAETHRKPVPFWHDIFFFYYQTKYRRWKVEDLEQVNILMKKFVEGYGKALPIGIRKNFIIHTYELIQHWTLIFKNTLELSLEELEDESINFHDPETFAKYIVEDMTLKKKQPSEKIKYYKEDEFLAGTGNN